LREASSSPQLNVTPPGLTLLTPISGTNAATVTVRIAVNPISNAGPYTAYLVVNAAPATTLGAPITIPVQVRAVESVTQVYLPLIAKTILRPSRRRWAWPLSLGQIWRQ
jgi:hypothetical protein